jgi:predicted HTH domain antitoxin
LTNEGKYSISIGGVKMQVVLNLPDINIKIEELKLLLAVKLLEEGIISLGKASEIVGYNEKTFSEILLKRGISPIKYETLDLREEFENA